MLRAMDATHAFYCRDCRDWLRKLERNIMRYSDSRGDPWRIDHAIDACITAWHMSDWVWGDTRPGHPARLGCRTDKAFQNAIVARYPPFALFREIANGSKHRWPNDWTRARGMGALGIDGTVALGWPAHPERPAELHAYVKQKDHVGHVEGDLWLVREFWRDYLDQHGL